MSANTNPIFPSEISTTSSTLIIDNGTDTLALIVAGVNGTRISKMVASSTAATPHVVRVNLIKSDVEFCLGVVTVPAGAGTTTGIPLVSVISEDLLGDDGCFYMAKDSTIEISLDVALVDVEMVSVLAVAGNY